ncbi:membrane protein insertase MisCA [Collibacillus ludicampi]|uniref:Membrane protein insertase MisCA n=1 Tax=Collibacillus ludicampi TaxID=2771369 RepID=A0AAV4LDT7_9BACL|nr:YidC/Oxa1 family membrane protein insertase [Collibacillus ludicampi]GIM45896.1 membrane protein insertase MisCA [Collibacillus ludicampi]
MRRLQMLLFTLLVVFSLTGCASAPGATLNRSTFWGQIVGFVSDSIDFFARQVHDYGLAILIVTVIIRILILPLMFKQLRYSKLMQEVQPEMQKIRETHKGNPQKMNEEMMKLYQKYKLNPLSGCLPILVQMPILIALYQAINTNIEIKKHAFLGLIPLGLPDHTFILPVLAALTTYVQQRMMIVNAQDPNQKMLLYIMPAMIFFFSYSFPAALSLYWVFSNLFTIAQTYFTKSLRPVPQGGTNK